MPIIPEKKILVYSTSNIDTYVNQNRIYHSTFNIVLNEDYSGKKKMGAY